MTSSSGPITASGAYTTDDLRNVTVAMTSGSTPATYTPGSERDAFAYALPGVQWNGGNGVSARLKRPLAKLTMQNKEAFRHGRPNGVGYLYERTDTVRCANRNGIRSSNPDNRVPNDNHWSGIGGRRLSLRACRRKIRRAVDHGWRSNQESRRAAAAAELHDQRDGHVRGIHAVI